MFSRLSNSWELVKASARVLAADKELLVFPILSAIASVLVMATFSVPTFLAGIFDAATTGGGVPIVGYVIGFLYYVVQYFVVIYCNSALVGAALIRLRGGDPTVGDGLRIANKHLSAILGYAVISATVGMILRALSGRNNSLGRIVASLIGMAWGLATFLAVPILVNEEVGPIDAIKRSVTYLKKTWGEQVAGNLGIGAVTGLVFFFVIMLMILLIMLAVMAESTALIIGTGAVFAVILVALALVSSALSSIYTAAVYRYAAEGEASGFFDRNLVTQAFRSNS
ncbi:MAG: hypothetical protein HZB53_08870 [Chloroflexi bacterium]|nr:hypothetical protein [Chloroflexota bacterium]